MRYKNKIKFKSIIITISTCFIILLPVSCSGQETNNKIITLTSQQKKADIEFFYDFVRENYPFVESIVNDKNLPGIYSFENDYILRAGKTKNNEEFIKLFAELIQILQQGTVHANILEGVMLPADFDTAKHVFYNDISLESFKFNNYWWNLLDIQSKFSYADIKIKYHKGEYMVTEDYKKNKCFVPKGSIITEIDGEDVHVYIKNLQNKIRLRFDERLKIPYSFQPSPFTTYGDDSKQYWDVGFRDKNGEASTCSIQKKEGFRDVGVYPSLMENVICRELTKDIAYIRLFRFPTVSEAFNDLITIQNFFNKEHSFTRLIIDIRNNNGGSKTYGEELLFKPFLTETKAMVEYASVKKSTYDKLSVKRKLISGMEGDNFDIQHGFGDIEKIGYECLPENIKQRNIQDDSYYYLKSTTTYVPDNKVDFSGDIFILTDNDCGSACDCLTRTFQLTKTAKIIGTNTAGGTASVLPLWIFELPNSHILFNVEIELNYNIDGSINEVVGTRPDINLATSTYPTPFPKSFEVNDLLNDEWIKWIIENE